MSPKEIVDYSSQGIVRVNAGRDKVGTGFIVDARGLVATNLHVVAGEAHIRIRLMDGTELNVTHVAAIDPERDLAILAVKTTKPLPALVLGQSAKMSAGDAVVAIGNPLGVLDYSVSNGLVSSVRRISDDLTILQISAPISVGSSGGPLFNQFGEVIGVTTAIITAGQNLNLAVPADYLRPLVTAKHNLSLVEFARFTRGANDEAEPETPAAKRARRAIPRHDLTLLENCSQQEIAAAFEAIDQAINTGAPLYNQGNHEACYRIYEGAAIRIERESTCAGVRAAFGDGLLRANSLDTPTDKAWALRDSFDGLVMVFELWASDQSGKAARNTP